VKNDLLSPLVQAPPPRPAWMDFKLLMATQLRVTWNKLRHWSAAVWLVVACMLFGFLSLMVYLGVEAYGALGAMDPGIARGFLSLLFLAGMAAQIFFGIATAFSVLYMSEDLELLFVAPVSTRAVFASKSLVVAFSNFLPVVFLILLPALFYGLLFSAGPLYYLWIIPVVGGLWAVGTALAELLNLLVMRIVPPHRSREAVGVIGAVGGIFIALLFQLPNLIISRSESFDISAWMAGQGELVRVMDWFPWGWSSLVLEGAATSSHLSALGWSLLLLLLGALLVGISFPLVERGFRRGWISLSEGGGGPRRKTARIPSSQRRGLRRREDALSVVVDGGTAEASGSSWRGMWSVARKDLLYLRRDTRAWFGYLVPLVFMLFFIGQYLYLSVESAQSSLFSVLLIYTIMFSGNMALQSFGREGEADWILNSVPLSGWPVVWGKLLTVILPTVLLMEALLAGTAALLRLSSSMILAMAVGAVFLSLGASAMGLNFSIRSCRFNPGNPMGSVSTGATMLMYLLNLIFILLLSLGVAYIFPPAELMAVLPKIPEVSFAWGFPETFLYLGYLLTRPLLWPKAARILWGVFFTGAVWSAVFFGFMASTVSRSRKGFQVEIITPKKLGVRS